MKKIKVHEAIGSVLCHDITMIVPGVVKEVAFKKGHIISEEDISKLLSLGKDHVYIWEKKEDMLHENEAALRLKELVAGEGLVFSEISEGKIDFIAEYDGLIKVKKEELFKLNSLGQIILATMHDNTPVKIGQKVAGTRVIPLLIELEKILKAEKTIKNKIIKVIPIISRKIGIITTGNEIFYGRIKDAFGPVIRKKVEEYGCIVLGQIILPDDKDKINEAIKDWITKGAEMIICTGGMSVDPDDVTPLAIRDTGAEVVSYGAPVLPGSMILVSYYGNIPVLGLPGCVMYNKRTVFDLILPRVLAGEKLSYEDIVQYGHGGLCLGCDDCTYPSCSFGKGG
ncbi:molybdopterin biosynthesis protein [Clostridium polyendosporum]|uniref:Molybdopterin molybdenumtransferase n=1 Tax=Clostridium polyendosporum TaxID=69208 RepID=A0A919S1H3_9CLOT|nr:molybdopterin-binding protein [Clostridium polyendosporum]GIM29704.1 molybdopterin biosynthesis protein [Clostridium polyendosporum]